MTAFLIALQFLTCLPVRLTSMPSPEQSGRSMLFYPLVGVVIGLVLWGLASFLIDAPVLLTSALVLALWVAFTGALHLDGLADSADAWLGGLGDRERTLSIMKDPRSGPVAVAVLVLVLLLKFTAIAAILASGHLSALVLAVVAGRGAMVMLFLTTPYARQGGLGESMARHMPKAGARGVLLATALGIWVVGGWAGFSLLLIVALLFVALRRTMMRRLQGTTGDTAGAMLELTECAAIVWLALI
jgi:adenosylcobinamide-GDP ribazoletransferase